jgi:hypothetical protein
VAPPRCVFDGKPAKFSLTFAGGNVKIMVILGMESPQKNRLGRADDSYRAGRCSGGVDPMRIGTRCKAGFLVPILRPAISIDIWKKVEV